MIKPALGEMLQIALDLAERGFHVIPLGDPFSPIPKRYVDDAGGDIDKARYAFSKKARVKWQEYQSRAPTEDELHRWFQQWPTANIGVLTNIIAVVDADTDDAAAFMRSGAVTRTPWEVKTPRPGVQFYYRVNPSLGITNSAAAGLDIRGIGGYVVAPGSTGGNMVRYEWSVDMSWGADDVSDLPMLTADDIAKIYAWRGRSEPANEIGDGTGDVLGHLGAVSLPHDGAPTQVGGRNNALASLVGQWVNAGLSIAAIHSKASAWNRSNPEPLPDAEVATTVSSVLRTHIKNGGMAPADFDLPPLQIFAKPIGQWDADDQAAVEDFWGEATLFRGSRLLVGGKPKLGKSAFAVAMGMAATIGGEFLGKQFARPLKVIWLQAEIHKAFVMDRVRRHMIGFSDEQRAMANENFIASGRCDIDLTNNNDMQAVCQLLDRYRPDIFIADPVINFSTAKENDNTEVRALLRRVDWIGEHFNCATVLLHHTGKTNDRADAFEALRGASAFRGWYDTGILLGGEQDCLVVSYEFRNAPPVAAHGLQFDTETGRYAVTDLNDLTDDQSAPGRSSHRRAEKTFDRDRDEFVETAIRIIEKQPGIMGGSLAVSISKKLGISESRAAHRVSEVARNPRVNVVEEGRHKRYFPASKANGNMT